MQRAVNPATGETVFLVDNQWVAPTQVAKNDAGQSAFLINNQWVIPPAPVVDSKPSILAGTTLPKDAPPMGNRTINEIGRDPLPILRELPKFDVSKMPTEAEKAAATFGLTPEMGTGEKALRTAKAAAYGASTALQQTWLGGARIIADLSGTHQDDVKGVSKQLAKEQGAVEKTFEDNYGLKIAKNIGESVLANVPTIYVGLAAGLPAAYTTMFGQSFLQTYDDSRNEGLNVAQSTARSALFGAAEVLGERIGLPTLFKGIKDIGAGVSAKELAKTAANFVMKDLTGEELTYLSQYLTDLSFGLNPQASLEQFFQGAIDTALVTVGQGAVMGGVGMATNKILKEIRKYNPEAEEGTVLQKGKNVTVEGAPPIPPSGTPAGTPPGAPPAGPQDLSKFKALEDQDIEEQDKERIDRLDALEAEFKSIDEKYKTATPAEFGDLNRRQGEITKEMNELIAGGVTPPTETTPPKGSSTGIKEALAGSAKGISDNFYQTAFDAIQAGKTKMSGVAEPILKKAKPYFDAGLITSPDMLRYFEEKGYPELSKWATPPAAPTETTAPKETTDLTGLSFIDWLKAKGYRTLYEDPYISPDKNTGATLKKQWLEETGQAEGKKEAAPPAEIKTFAPITSVPNSAFNGDLEQSLYNVFNSEDYSGKPVQLSTRGFRQDEIDALEKAGLATNGSMSQNQFNQWDEERGNRVSGKSKENLSPTKTPPKAPVAKEEKPITPEERSAFFEKNRIARQREAVEKAKSDIRTPLKEVTDDDLTVATKAMELAGKDVEMTDAALPHLKKLETAGLIKIKPGRRKSFTLTNSGEALRGSFYDMSQQEKQAALKDFLKGSPVKAIEEKPKNELEKLMEIEERLESPTISKTSVVPHATVMVAPYKDGFVSSYQYYGKKINGQDTGQSISTPLDLSNIYATREVAIKAAARKIRERAESDKNKVALDWLETIAPKPKTEKLDSISFELDGDKATIEYFLDSDGVYTRRDTEIYKDDPKKEVVSELTFSQYKDEEPGWYMAGTIQSMDMQPLLVTKAEAQRMIAAERKEAEKSVAEEKVAKEKPKTKAEINKERQTKQKEAAKEAPKPKEPKKGTAMYAAMLLADAQKAGDITGAQAKSLMYKEMTSTVKDYIAAIEKAIADTKATKEKEVHIEGKKEEPVTSKTIEESMEKAVSKVDYAKIKTAVKNQFDQAIKRATIQTQKEWDRTATDSYVTIDVPGDGKFKVKNNVERLKELQSKIVNAITPKAAPTYGGPSSGAKEAFKSMVDENDMENAMEYAKLQKLDIKDVKLSMIQKRRVDRYLKNPAEFERQAAVEEEKPSDRELGAARERLDRELAREEEARFSAVIGTTIKSTESQLKSDISKRKITSMDAERMLAVFPNYPEGVVKPYTVKQLQKLVGPTEKNFVVDDEGDKLTFPLFVDMDAKGYKVLSFDNPRTYENKGGTKYRTVEKDGVRLAFGTNEVLFYNPKYPNRPPQIGNGNDNQIVWHFLGVDPAQRNKGKATKAVADLMEVADKNSYTLFGEPAQLEEKGMTAEQLSKFYSKFGFGPRKDSKKIIVREPGGKSIEDEDAGNPGSFVDNVVKDFAEKAQQDFLIGDDVRVGNSPGTVVGIEGDYIKFRPISATNPKAYQRIQKKNVEFVSRPSEGINASASKNAESKFGTEAGQLNADMAGLVQLLGANMYASNLVDVTVKELLQNAFDAVKGAVSSLKEPSLYKSGHITIEIDDRTRTIKITDDARGMSTDIVKNALFTVAGSDKSDLAPEDRSGGLGLAKMGFMMGAERLKVDTVRDGVRTIVDTSGENIARSNFEIKKTPAPKKEHGTTIEVTIPTHYTDPKTGDKKDIWFTSHAAGLEALKNPLIGPVEIKLIDDSYGAKTEKILASGINFDEEATPFLTKANFDWGSADIYFGVQRKDHPKHQVLSSGVYQFNGPNKYASHFMLSDQEKIPYDVIVNVKPKVEAKHPDYPFENSRETFKSRLNADIESLEGFLRRVARGEEAKDLKESFEGIVSMPRVEVGQDIAEVSKKLKKVFDQRSGAKETKAPEMPKQIVIRESVVSDTQGKVIYDKAKEEEKKKASTFQAEQEAPTRDEFMIEMAQDPKLPIFHNNTNVNYIEVGRQYGDPEKFFAELGTLMVEMKEEMAKSGIYKYDILSPENLFFAGISIDKGYGGVFIKVPYKGMFLNPFYGWGARSLFGVRQNYLNTMIHEIAHTGEGSHGVAHNTQIIRVEQYLADQGLLDYYRDALLDILSRHESTFTAMKEAYEKSTTANIAKSLEDIGGTKSARGDEGGGGNKIPKLSSRTGQGGNEPVRSGSQKTEEGVKGRRSKIESNPAFKKWFKGSTIIDKEGNPKVVYHTTPSESFEEDQPFDEFDEGLNYFSEKPDETYGDFAYPVYLSIKNPYDFGTMASEDGAYVYENGTEALDEDDEPITIGWLKENPDVIDDMISRGFDGAIDGPDFIVAFENTQIKSALTGKGGEEEKTSMDEYLAQREADGREDFKLKTSKSVKDMLLGSYAAAREAAKAVKESPMLAVNKMTSKLDRAITYARIKGVWYGRGLEVAEVKKFNGKVKDGQEKAIATVALTNALHSGEIMSQAIMRGKLMFDTESQMFRAEDAKESLANVMLAKHDLIERVGAQEANNMIQDYFEAKRSRSILNAFQKQEGIVEKAKEKAEKIEFGTDAYYDALDEVEKAKNDFYNIAVARSKVKLSDESIDIYSALEDDNPELRNMMDNWQAVNSNNLDNMEFSGLISKKRAKSLHEIEDYVPWQRIQDEMEDVHSAPVRGSTKSLTNVAKEKVFKRNAAVNKAAREYIDGEIDIDQFNEAIQLYQENLGEIDDILDNMLHNTAVLGRNSMRNHAANMIASRYAERYTEGKKAGKLKIYREEGRDDNGVRLNIVVNGKRVIVNIPDPLIAEAVIGMENINMPAVEIFAVMANLLRRGITTWPQFQLRQLFMDAPTAAMVSGLGAKNSAILYADTFKSFLNALNSEDPIVRHLKAYGIGGFQSYTRSPEQQYKQQIGLIEQNKLDQFTNILDKIGDASDMAQRIATYKRVLAETGDETLALMRSNNIIDFKKHGNAKMVVAITRSVSFMNAYAQQLDVLAEALAGGGLKGKNRAAAFGSMLKVAAMLTMWTTIYTWIMGGNDDYEKMDDQKKARNFVIPKNLTKHIGVDDNILLPMNTSAAYFFKAMPELITNYVLKKGTKNEVDGTRLRKALAEAAIDSLLGPNPIATGIKPAVEIGLNRNFFTGGAITPKGLEGLDAAEQYNASTSELGKILSAVTGGVLNPIEMDHLVRGIFGTNGAVVMWGSNMLSGDRPTAEQKDNPLWGGIMDRDVGRGPETLFYDLKSEVEPKHKTFMKLIEREKDVEADKYFNKHEKEIAAYEYVTGIESALKEINKEIRRVSEVRDPKFSKDDRRKEVQELQRTKNEILEDVIQIRKEAGL